MSDHTGFLVKGLAVAESALTGSSLPGSLRSEPTLQ